MVGVGYIFPGHGQQLQPAAEVGITNGGSPKQMMTQQLPPHSTIATPNSTISKQRWTPSSESSDVCIFYFCD